MDDPARIDRRDFLKGTAAGIGSATVAASSLRAAEETQVLASAPAAPKVDPKDLIWRSKAATMDYRRLGRTNYMVSRVVAGSAGNEALWRRMMAAGVNYFDTGSNYGGGNHEIELSGILSKYKDKLWITSKASEIAGYARIDEEVRKMYAKAISDFLGDGKDIDPKSELLDVHKKAIEKEKKTGQKPDLRPVGRRIAKMYLDELDASLGRMKVESVDCYMMHGVEIPWIFDCLELWEAYERVHKAGKVRHFGYSVHRHQKDVLAATVEANKRGPWKIDLIMPGINPGSFDNLKPELEALKKQDVGIIAMKTKGIKARPADAREDKFKALMGGKDYNDDQRAKLWMLHLTDALIDAVIARMGSNEDMEAMLPLARLKLSAKAERELRAIVKLQMGTACHLCGNCEANCPEHIAVTNMIRYYAYLNDYKDRELAESLYRKLGYNPAAVCTNCGACEQVCPSHLPISNLLHEITAALA
jgi:predicted aldo/keto reductase-like oxidoreductase